MRLAVNLGLAALLVLVVVGFELLPLHLLEVFVDCVDLYFHGEYCLS